MGSREMQTDAVVASAEKPRRVPTEEEFAAQHPEPPPAHWISYGHPGRFFTTELVPNFYAVDPVLEKQAEERERSQR